MRLPTEPYLLQEMCKKVIKIFVVNLITPYFRYIIVFFSGRIRFAPRIHSSIPEEMADLESKRNIGKIRTCTLNCSCSKFRRVSAFAAAPQIQHHPRTPGVHGWQVVLKLPVHETGDLRPDLQN